MTNNGMRYISSVALLTIAILVAINIHDSEAKMTVAQIRNMLKPVSNTCIQKVGVSKDLIAKTHDGEFSPDPILQCYFSCIFKMMKVITKDDMIDINMIIKQMDIMVQEDIAEPIKEICQSCYDKITSSEICEASWELVKCFYESDPSVYFFP